MDLRIIKAEEKDLDKINKILIERCKWFNDNNINQWSSYYIVKYNIEYFKEQMKINKLYIAKKGDEICGVMLLKSYDPTYWNNDDNAYYIHHFATSLNNKGLGELMLKFAIDISKKDGKKFLRLDCVSTNKVLNNYYKKHNFKFINSGKVGKYNFNLWEYKI